MTVAQLIEEFKRLPPDSIVRDDDFSPGVLAVQPDGLKTIPCYKEIWIGDALLLRQVEGVCPETLRVAVVKCEADGTIRTVRA